MVDLENAITALLNMTLMYSTRGHAVLEKMTTPKRLPSKSDVFRLKKRSHVEGKAATRPALDIKERDVLDDIVHAPSTSILEATNECMPVMLEVIKSIFTVYDGDFEDLVETHEDVEGEMLKGRFISS